MGLCVFFVLYTTTAAMMGVQDWTEPGYSSVGGIGGGSNHGGDAGYGGGGSDGSGSNGGFIYKDYNNGNNNHNNNNNNNNAPNPIPPSSYNKDGSQGGIDWNIGPDAPPPIPGASLSPILKHHLADWPSGTHRLLHGGIVMEEAVLFRELPYFWGESFAGMEVLEDVLGNCFKLVSASDLGKAALNSVGNEGHNPSSVLEEEEADDKSNLLSIVTILARQYVNVDLTTQPGIDRASVLALSSSGMADVVYSPHLTEMTFKIFDSDHRGRMFVLMMHPVLREFKRFRHLRRMSMVTSSNNNHDNGSSEGEDIRSMTYVTYAESDYVSSNWMTRNLVNKLDPKEELTVTDMHTAKEVLRSKAVVGLHDDFLGAMRHYARYFGWDNGATGEKLSDTLTCMGTAIMEGMMRENMEEELINNDSNIGRGSEGAGGTDGENMGSAPLDKEDAVEGSTAWKILLERNKFDVELYIYSQLLYKYQMGLS